MTFSAIWFAIRRFIIYPIKDHWRIILPVIAVLILILFLYAKCGRKPATIDIESVEKINHANESERKKEIERVVERNADIVRTVDERTTIAETNVVERNTKIAEKVKQADAAIVEAKKSGKDITSDELECLLIPTNCK